MHCPICKEPAIDRTFYECLNGHSWWAPNPGPQTRFLECGAHEVLYGGAAGGGKSAALVMTPLPWISHPRFRGIILRRETTQLKELIDLSRRWYPIADPGARAVQEGGALEWRFSSGAKQSFNHCKDPKDAFNYQGREFQLIGFDELTHFVWEQYQELKSRVRASVPGLPRYLRSTSNPGGDGHEWVFVRWGAWLNPEFETDTLKPRKVHTELVDAKTGAKVIHEASLPPLKSGEVAWIEKKGDVEIFLAEKPKIVDPAVHGSRTFIGAKVTDNRVLMINDPGYVRNLKDLDPVRRMQLEMGDWLVKPAKGLFFKRAWWKLCDAVPAKGLRVRYWDRAASEDQRADWTAGVLMVRIDDEYWIENVVRCQDNPGIVEKTILMTAELDKLKYGNDVMPVLEMDPGQAGKAEAYQYAKLLSGFPLQFRKPTGDKLTRARPYSAQVFAGNVHLMKAEWTERFIQEHEGFPEGTNDDQVDSGSGAYNTLFLLGGGSKKAAGVRAPPPNPEETPLG